MRQTQAFIARSAPQDLAITVLDCKGVLCMTVVLLQFKEGDRVYGLADTFTFLKKEGAVLLVTTPTSGVQPPACKSSK